MSSRTMCLIICLACLPVCMGGCPGCSEEKKPAAVAQDDSKAPITKEDFEKGIGKALPKALNQFYDERIEPEFRTQRSDISKLRGDTAALRKDYGDLDSRLGTVEDRPPPTAVEYIPHQQGAGQPQPEPGQSVDQVPPPPSHEAMVRAHMEAERRLDEERAKAAADREKRISEFEEGALRAQKRLHDSLGDIEDGMESLRKGQRMTTQEMRRIAEEMKATLIEVIKREESKAGFFLKREPGMPTVAVVMQPPSKVLVRQRRLEYPGAYCWVDRVRNMVTMETHWEWHFDPLK